MHEQLGQILDKKTKKTKLPLLKILDQKQGTVQASCTHHHLRGDKTPKPLPWLQPWAHPYPHLMQQGSPTLGPQITPWPVRKLSHTAGEQQVSQQSSICISSCFPSLPLPPDLHLLSDQQGH